MALLGFNGSVTLFREWPDPAVLTADDLLQAGGVVRLNLEGEEWWSGDRVHLTAPAGLPFDLNGDGYADCPDGHRFYGPEPVAGPATLHRTDDEGPFYRQDDQPFYDSPATTGLTTELTAYLRRDDLDRATFYRTEVNAVNGDTAGQIPLLPVGFETLTVTPAWDSTDGWKQVSNLQGFVIDIDPSNLDTAAIGEEFGSYVRGLVRGAGSFNGQMSNLYLEGVTNTARIARLVLLTRRGSKAQARFELSPGDTEGVCAPEPPLFYEAEILFGRTTVTLALEGAIALQAEFVMTTEPRLVMDYPSE